MAQHIKTGLICGSGELPFAAINNIRSAGNVPVVCAPREFADIKKLQKTKAEMWIQSFGQLGRVIREFKKRNVKEILLVGKTPKEQVMKMKFDARALTIFTRSKTSGDQSLLLTLVKILEEEGFKVVAQKKYLREFIPSAGYLGGRHCPISLCADVRYGYTSAKKVAALDIGQVVAVYKKSIVAVEAYEGTDEMIHRAGSLVKKNCVIVKVARQGQDPRFDTPGIGAHTVRSAIKAGIKVLAFEAGKTFFLEQEQCRKLAAEAGLSLLAIDATYPATGKR